MTLGRSWVLFLTLIWASRALAIADPIMLSLKPSVVVTGERVRLAQIASVESSDRAAAAELAGVELDTNLQSGRTVLIDRSIVMQMLMRRAPQIAWRLSWKGLSQIRVRRSGQTVDITKVVTAASAYLEKELNSRFRRVVVTPISQALAKVETASDPQLSFITHGPVRRRMAVQVDIHDGISVRTIPIWFSVSAIGDVWQVIQDIPSGAEIAPSLLQLAEVDVATATDEPVPTDQAPAGAIARVPLRAGSILAKSQVQVRPDVIVGDDVRVRVTRGSVTIESTGVALQRGYMGDRVRVKNASNGEAFWGRVAGWDMVEVRP